MIPFGSAGALQFISIVVDEEASTKTPCGRLGSTVLTPLLVNVTIIPLPSNQF